jgi:phenylalanyl-tRNA synthetase alpha chain
MEQIDHIINQSRDEIENAGTLRELEELRIKYLSKNGIISEKMQELKHLDEDSKKEFGKALNQAKTTISSCLSQKQKQLEEAELERKLRAETQDVTAPARKRENGTIHPVRQTIEEVIEIFGRYGFRVAEGPSIDNDWYNFEALNIGSNHPARQMHDTFYLKQDRSQLLRTHTSTIQVREMEKNKPPIRILAPGRTYRSDSDMTHTPMFHQIEGLLVEEDIDMGHLKGAITEFLQVFFEKSNIPVRFRPSFFPFTEPSAEVDIGCKISGGQLKISEDSDWMEILGCGMVHPNVLKNVGVNPDKYNGFAFGIGVERLAMLKYGMSDLRDFFEGDLRWLRHYGFSGFNIPNLVGGLSR